MSAWKSPLLFIGFVLIAAAAAALFAPLYVDWNTYRAEFEDYGRQVTGRAVTIEGPIEARLFPWPVLVLNDVKIANLEGTLAANLMEAGRIEMGMSLAPLMSGQIEVDTVAVDSPVFAFERLASGAASWTIEPDESLPALIDPDRVLVSEISITNGTVLAADHRREGMARIDELAGTLSAPSLSGPWRLRGSASHAGSPFEINLSTGKLVTGEALRVGLRISPAAGAGVIYSFDGELARPEGKSLKGAVKIIPTRERDAPAAESGIPRFEVKADVEGDFDAVALTGIEASPAFSTDPGNFITGAARIDLGQRIAIEAKLSTARIDLGRMLGRHGRAVMQSDGAFEALAQFLARTPEALDLRVDLSAASVVVGGDTLDASRLSFALDSERLRIEDFTTAMPGQTRTRLSGLLVYGGGEPMMSGDVSIESVSLRDFVEWAAPDRRRAISEVWLGSRGRLMLEARLDVSSGRGVRLSEVEATLDDARISGSLNSQGGPDPRFAVRIDADRLDLDRYMPRGLGDRAGTGFGSSGLAAAVAELVGQAMTLGEVQLTAGAGELRFHGVEAKDIAIDIGADENVLELRTVEIGQVGAARLDVTGLVSFAGDALEGSVSAIVDAEDPRALLRLLGAFGPEERNRTGVGRGAGAARRQAHRRGQRRGRRHDCGHGAHRQRRRGNAALEGRFRGERANWQEGEIELSGEMDAKSSALLAAITGLQLYERLRPPDAGVGSVSPERCATGLRPRSRRRCSAPRGSLPAPSGKAQRTIEAEGRVAVLAEDAAELFAIVGVPADDLSPIAQVLAAESEVTYDGRGLRLPTLSGTAGRIGLQRRRHVRRRAGAARLGEITTDHLSLPWLLGALLLPRDGSPHALASHFASAVPRVEADLAIAAGRLEMLPHVAVESSELALKVGRYGLTLEGRGSGPGGKPATGRSTSIDGRGVNVEGAIAGPVDLGALLRASDGSQVLNADGHVELAFSGSGRSPAGVLTAIAGRGPLRAGARGAQANVDPDTFAATSQRPSSPPRSTGCLPGRCAAATWRSSGGSGTLTFTDGVLQAKPLDIIGQGLTGEARFVLEAASGDVDLSFTLNLAGQRDIPSFETGLCRFAAGAGAVHRGTEPEVLSCRCACCRTSVQQLEELQRQERELIEAERSSSASRRSANASGASRQREADMQAGPQAARACRPAEAQEREAEGARSRAAQGRPRQVPKPRGRPATGASSSEPARQPEPELRAAPSTVTVEPLDAPSLARTPAARRSSSIRCRCRGSSRSRTGAAARSTRSTSRCKVPPTAIWDGSPSRCSPAPDRAARPGQPDPEMGRR
jgi:hypothetical protein